MAISKESLRIGNLVVLAHESNAPIVEVFELENDTATVFSNEKGYNVVTYESLLPIDLSEYWLERLGFEKKKIEGNSSGYWYNNNGLSYNESHKGWWYRGHFPNAPKSVHMLQNLYFSLFGEELTIKEPINDH